MVKDLNTRLNKVVEEKNITDITSNEKERTNREIDEFIKK